MHPSTISGSVSVIWCQANVTFSPCLPFSGIIHYDHFPEVKAQVSQGTSGQKGCFVRRQSFNYILGVRTIPNPRQHTETVFMIPRYTYLEETPIDILAYSQQTISALTIWLWLMTRFPWLSQSFTNRQLIEWWVGVLLVFPGVGVGVDSGVGVGQIPGVGVGVAYFFCPESESTPESHIFFARSRSRLRSRMILEATPHPCYPDSGKSNSQLLLFEFWLIN